jgi:transposase
LRRSRMLPFFENLPPCLVGMEASATAITGRARLKRWT